ncbi:hypothetical protein HER39_12530 [Arthrobacter deserti]|uniref:Uncharacterized protein n=1 Tax=Arthrobacter deserti TaxID=1742687 RepID=A0ABX1JSR8_9MICC|nr:hypothetical protein [Arthrobacter deserti]
MEPLNHRELLVLLEQSEPGFLAGTFATVFPRSVDQEGEAGAFTCFDGGFWDVRYDTGRRTLLTPWGSLTVSPEGSEDHGPAMADRPRVPPWSLVVPRCSTFLGRACDSWQIDAGKPMAGQGDSLTVVLTSLEQPSATGTLTVDTRLRVIASVDLGHVVQTLTIDRTSPGAADAAAFRKLRIAVRPFGAR